jgi:isoleucyl-tRNA synthetase
LLYIVKRFLTAVAPVLSFTAEEAWQEIPERLRAGEMSVFDSSFGPGGAADVELWEVLRDLRARVGASEIRDFKARVDLVVSPTLYAKLAKLGDNLREALVVSELHLSKGEGEDVIGFAIAEAHGEKCRRCWKFRELGTDAAHPSICAECAAVVNAL